MVFSISHKTILRQQMCSTVHITIMNLNNIHVFWKDAQRQICATEYLQTMRAKCCSKTYTLIYYTLKMHFDAVFLPNKIISLSLLCSFSCGRQYWAPSHATSICVKGFPLRPSRCRVLQQWLMSLNMASHIV